MTSQRMSQIYSPALTTVWFVFPCAATSRLAKPVAGLVAWWNRLLPSTQLSEQRLRKLAGDFARRVHAYARKHKIPLRYLAIGDKTKHAQAEKLRPADPKFRGVFAIFVAKASALVWQAKNNRDGKVVLRRPKNWPLVYHYHFHIVDPQWGHLTIQMSGHPPFGLQIALNGHEWVQRQAQKQAISWVKEGNCFVGGSDLAGLNRLAQQLGGARGLAGQQILGLTKSNIFCACAIVTDTAVLGYQTCSGGVLRAAVTEVPGSGRTSMISCSCVSVTAPSVLLARALSKSSRNL